MGKAALRSLQSRFADPLLTGLTVTLAIVLFVIAPLQAAGVIAAHYFGFAFGAVLLAAIFVVSGSWFAAASATIAIVLIAVATVLRLRQPSVMDIFLDAAGWLIAGLTLTVVVANAVFASGKVTFHRIVGAVLLYLVIGTVFTALFTFVAMVATNAFAGLGPLRDNLTVAANLIYFSFVTLSSVGYGDIAPLHPVARGLANVEAIIGQLYPATLLARLVTLELEDRRTS
jgi:hypothetical protein